MLVLHYSTTFNALHRYIDLYNQGQDNLCDKVRQSATSTAKDIIRIYGKALIKAANSHPIKPDKLPSLRTNNIQLSKMSNASPRTIQRHIHKLIEAGIITHKVWHGTNSDYELWINPLILLVSLKKSSKEAKIELNRLLAKALKEEVVTKGLKSICPHTNTGNPRNINNIVIEVDKSLSSASSNKTGYETGNETGNETQRSSPSLTVSNSTSYKTRYAGENVQKNSKGAGENTRLRTEQNKELNAPKRSSERTASLSFYASMLWILAKNVLYREVYLTDRQEEKAKELLLHWYDPVPDKHLSNVHQCYLERVGLVRKYLNKDPRRYVQLPYLYFDTKNPSGFAGTKVWHEKHLIRKNEVRNHLILSNQIRRFLNNDKKEPDKRKPPLQLYRECETRVGKLKDPLLLQEFHASILNPPVYDQLYT